MAVKRMDHTTLVVRGLDAAVAFFEALGMEVEGRAHVSGDAVDRLHGAPDGAERVAADLVMLVTPDSHSRIELTRYVTPDVVEPTPWPLPVHVVGWANVMFEVDDLRETVARLEAVGGSLVGEVVAWEGVILLAYVRGPEGVVVALAQPVE